MNRRYTGEFGYTIQITTDTDLSTATSVVLKAKNGSVTKSLSGTVSPSTTFTATVPQDFFDTEGIWHLQLQATYASSVRYQDGFTELEIKQGL